MFLPKLFTRTHFTKSYFTRTYSTIALTQQTINNIFHTTPPTNIIRSIDDNNIAICTNLLEQQPNLIKYIKPELQTRNMFNIVAKTSLSLLGYFQSHINDVSDEEHMKTFEYVCDECDITIRHKLLAIHKLIPLPSHNLNQWITDKFGKYIIKDLRELYGTMYQNEQNCIDAIKENVHNVKYIDPFLCTKLNIGKAIMQSNKGYMYFQYLKLTDELVKFAFDDYTKRDINDEQYYSERQICTTSLINAIEDFNDSLVAYACRTSAFDFYTSCYRTSNNYINIKDKIQNGSSSTLEPDDLKYLSKYKDLLNERQLSKL